MKKAVKYLLPLLVIIILIYFGVKQFLPISINEIEEEFSRQENSLIVLVDYFEELEYESLYVTSNSPEGTLFVRDTDEELGKDIKVTNDLVVDTLTDLLTNHNFSVITKDRNGIYFQLWSNRDYGRGIVYSMDGKVPDNEFLTQIKSLSEENWYFYEER